MSLHACLPPFFTQMTLWRWKWHVDVIFSLLSTSSWFRCLLTYSVICFELNCLLDSLNTIFYEVCALLYHGIKIVGTLGSSLEEVVHRLKLPLMTCISFIFLVIYFIWSWIHGMRAFDMLVWSAVTSHVVDNGLEQTCDWVLLEK